MSNRVDAFASAISSPVFVLLTFQGNLSHHNPLSVGPLMGGGTLAGMQSFSVPDRHPTVPP